MLRYTPVVVCVVLLTLAVSAGVCEDSPTAVKPAAGGSQPAAAVSAPLFSDIENDPRKQQITLVAGRRILQGYPDGTFRPSGTIVERDFAGVVDRLIVACPSMAKPVFETKNPDEPMTRLRAVTVLMRAAADKKSVESVPAPKEVLSKFSDLDKIPEWGRKQLAYAVYCGYMRLETEFRPSDPITRSELAELIVHSIPSSALHSSQCDAMCTGLIVDCRGLQVARSMCPPIVSEDGTRIYPDMTRLPSIDFLEDQGLVSYSQNAAECKRAGDKPMEAKALRVEGPARHTVVVSDADRDAILAAEKESHFLANWNVVFLVDPK